MVEFQALEYDVIIFVCFQLEEEITTLKSALERKEKQYADLKKELGITTWSQLKEGIGSQLTYIQNSGVYV